MRFAGVAGVYAPAFVERIGVFHFTGTLKCVAGVYAPAFVERCHILCCHPEPFCSVAGVYAPAFVERLPIRKQSFTGPGGVAGVYAPAFVERWRSAALSLDRTRCRRGLCPGLR